MYYTTRLCVWLDSFTWLTWIMKVSKLWHFVHVRLRQATCTWPSGLTNKGVMQLSPTEPFTRHKLRHLHVTNSHTYIHIYSAKWVDIRVSHVNVTNWVIQIWQTESSKFDKLSHQMSRTRAHMKLYSSNHDGDVLFNFTQTCVIETKVH